MSLWCCCFVGGVVVDSPVDSPVVVVVVLCSNVNMCGRTAAIQVGEGRGGEGTLRVRVQIVIRNTLLAARSNNFLQWPLHCCRCSWCWRLLLLLFIADRFHGSHGTLSLYAGSQARTQARTQGARVCWTPETTDGQTEGRTAFLLSSLWIKVSLLSLLALGASLRSMINLSSFLLFSPLFFPSLTRFL